MFLPFLLAPLVVCLIERNELEAADRLLVRRGLACDLDEIGGSDVVLLARGRLRIAQGRPDDAIADLRQLGRWMEAWGTANPSAMPWRSSLASVLVRQGEIAEARELAAEELRLARRWGTPRAIGVALRSAGEAAGRKRSVALLEQAVHTLEASAGRLEHARALLSLGLSLRREGRRARHATPWLGLRSSPRGWVRPPWPSRPPRSCGWQERGLGASSSPAMPRSPPASAASSFSRATGPPIATSRSRSGFRSRRWRCIWETRIGSSGSPRDGSSPER